jgi:crossover junction endodeoxyribonuclease RuvC
MLILGIDPGTAETGYGVIKCDHTRVTLVKHGMIKTSSTAETGTRLVSIFDQATEIFIQFEPETVAIESLFFNVNALSASAVGQAIGVIKLAAAKQNIQVVDIPPLRIKMRLTGNGRAKKPEIQSEVRKALKIRKIPRPTHAADALAVAICHWKMLTNTEPPQKIKASKPKSRKTALSKKPKEKKANR